MRRLEDGSVEGPINRRVFGTFKGPRSLFKTLLREAKKRGYGLKETLFVADGEARLWKHQKEFFPLATPCLDWYHLAEYLWTAIGAVHCGGAMVFDASHNTGTGHLNADGYVRGTPIRWETDDDGVVHCDRVELVQAAAVVGKVDQVEGPKIFISGCGGKTSKINDDGTFYIEVAPGDECEIRAAWVLPGTVLQEGEPVVVIPTLDSDTHIELELPPL